MKNTFIYNNYLEAQKVLSTLEKELEQCDEFIFSVAFISESGLTSLLQTLEDMEKRNIPGKILTTNYLYFNTPKALDKLNKFKNIDDFAKEKGKLVPISPQNAQWTVIEEYNKKHNASPIELTAAESFQIADAYAWVLEGRYDAFFDIKLSFEKAVTDKAGSYHQYVDQLSWFPYKGIPTYPLIHKDKKNEEFAKAYEKAIKELEKDGTLSKLSEKYFGEDVFSYVDKD